LLTMLSKVEALGESGEARMDQMRILSLSLSVCISFSCIMPKERCSIPDATIHIPCLSLIVHILAQDVHMRREGSKDLTPEYYAMTKLYSTLHANHPSRDPSCQLIVYCRHHHHTTNVRHRIRHARQNRCHSKQTPNPSCRQTD
jgi:hypothetical protein